MAADFFDPTTALLSETQARLDALSKPAEAAATLAGQSAQSAPQPAPAPPAVDLVRTFEQAADQYGVPVDALMAMAEKDSGFDHLSRSRGPGPKSRGIIRMSDDDMARERANPYDAPQAIGVAARKLRSFMDRGVSLHDAIKAHGGSDDYLADVQARAKRLADTLYPEEAPVDPAAHNMDAPKPAAAAPADADAHLKIVADYEARAEQMFEDGDITAAEYRRAMREASDKRDEIKWSQHKADLADQMQQQAENRAWSKAVREFMSTTGAAIKSDPMRRAFDQYVQRVTGDAANAHLSDKAQLAKAHRLFMADMQSGAAEAADMGGGAGHADFAAIDRMIDSDPLRAEEALARMSPEEVERYLA